MLMTATAMVDGQREGMGQGSMNTLLIRDNLTSKDAKHLSQEYLHSNRRFHRLTTAKPHLKSKQTLQSESYELSKLPMTEQQKYFAIKGTRV